MKNLGLCVGINKYPQSPLSGCVNDAYDWGGLLASKDYDVRYLLDGDATLVNIREALKELVSRASYRDRVVFQYSGHGTYAPDMNSDEVDRQDEAICPVDCFNVGMLYDDEIGDILESRPYGVRLLQISDSCYSGTVSRLFGVGAQANAKAKFLPPQMLPRRAKPAASRSLIRRRNLLMSGCTDAEYSYDAWFGSRPNGAFSRVALDALRQAPTSYKSWHSIIRQTLPSSDFPQTPLLEGTYYKKRWTPLV